MVRPIPDCPDTTSMDRMDSSKKVVKNVSRERFPFSTLKKQQIRDQILLIHLIWQLKKNLLFTQNQNQWFRLAVLRNMPFINPDYPIISMSYKTNDFFEGAFTLSFL